MAKQTIDNESRTNNLAIPGHSRDFAESTALINIKIEIEDEETYFFCNKCRKKCEGYCNKYAGLTHFLNREISPSSSEWKRGTIPICLEIRNEHVFALKTIPENVIFGLFKGITPLESISGYMWRMKDGKLLNIENGNWMQYVNRAESALLRNVEVFQFEGSLYFQTIKEINIGEVLLMYYNEEDLNGESNCQNYIPFKADNSQDIYACTFCCLGFRLKEYLIQHKHRCRDVHNENFTLEIVQCKSCKIWLEEGEYLEYHTNYCVEDSRVCNYPAPIARINASRTKSPQHALGNDENLNEVQIPTTNNTQAVTIGKRFKCMLCPYQTNRNIDLKIHQDIHTGVKRFQCGICRMKFGRKSNLNRHTERRHSEITEHFKCTKCQFETHREEYLTKHTETKHVEDDSRKLKCQRCSYVTLRKDCFENHIKTHGDVKPFRCEMCNIGFNYKSGLDRHLKNKHMETIENDPNAFECQHCDVSFGLKSELKQHMKDVHRKKVGGKEYRCGSCVYKTNDKSKLKKHLSLHIQNEVL